MKRIGTNSYLFLIPFLISTAFYMLEKNDTVRLKVTKTENGEKQVFEKQYGSMEELKADGELRDFDLLVEEWIDEDGNEFVFEQSGKSVGEKTVVIKKKSGDGNELTWVSDDGNVTEFSTEDVMVLTDKDGKVEKNIIKIKTDGDEENFTVEIDGDGHQKMIWVDDEGNKTELTEENIEKMIAEERSENSEKTHKIEILKKDGRKVTVHDGKEKLIEVMIEKDTDENGEDVIVDKKVWVSENGEKTLLDDENSFEFESEGGKVTVTVDKQSFESADFSGGKFKGDNMIIVKNKSENKPGIRQTMDVNIEEKNGEKFIDIAINRDKEAGLTITEFGAEDTSLNGTALSLKNNLKPSELKYYPNPGTGRFTLDFTLDRKDEVLVTVSDILGKEVYTEKLPDFSGVYRQEIDLTGKEKGIYILQIKQKKKSLSRKILIE